MTKIKAVLIRPDTTDEVTIEVNTYEAAQALGVLADIDMSWGSYNILVGCIRSIDERVKEND